MQICNFPEIKKGSPFFWVKDKIANTEIFDGEIKGNEEIAKLKKALKTLGLSYLIKSFLKNKLSENEKTIIEEKIFNHLRQFKITKDYISHNEIDESVKWLSKELETACNVSSIYKDKDKYYDEYIYRINNLSKLQLEINYYNFIVQAKNFTFFEDVRFPEISDGGIFFKIKDKQINTEKIDGKIQGNEEIAKLKEALNILNLGNLTTQFINNSLSQNDKKTIVNKIKLHLNQAQTTPGAIPHHEINENIKWLAEEIGTANLNWSGSFHTYSKQNDLKNFIEESKARKFAIEYSIQVLKKSKDNDSILQAIKSLEINKAKKATSLLYKIMKEYTHKKSEIKDAAKNALLRIGTEEISEQLLAEVLCNSNKSIQIDTMDIVKKTADPEHLKMVLLHILRNRDSEDIYNLVELHANEILIEMSKNN